MSRSYFIREGGKEEAPSKFVRGMKHGETFRAEMAGSGGYGDPLARDAEAVAEDVRQEKISMSHAEAEYGVIVDSATQALDQGATEALRAGRRSAAAE